jgi:hypothetical protein
MQGRLITGLRLGIAIALPLQIKHQFTLIDGLKKGLRLKPVEMCFCAFERFFDLVAHDGEVSHFAAGASFAFVVEVELTKRVAE